MSLPFFFPALDAERSKNSGKRTVPAQALECRSGHACLGSCVTKKGHGLLLNPITLPHRLCYRKQFSVRSYQPTAKRCLRQGKTALLLFLPRRQNSWVTSSAKSGSQLKICRRSSEKSAAGYRWPILKGRRDRKKAAKHAEQRRGTRNSYPRILVKTPVSKYRNKLKQPGSFTRSIGIIGVPILHVRTIDEGHVS